jgi:serine/threonine-protein kinase
MLSSTSEPLPKPVPSPRLPRKFGHYLLFDRIGAGGMAEIFLARARTDLGGQRLVIVKQILPALAAHPEFAEMLVHEAKLAAQLDHANVVQVTDLGRADGQLYIAMEYVEGFDLNDLLRRCTKEKVPLPLEFALAIISDTLRALDYAHRRTSEDGAPLGIVHRDVSPSNVLVSFDGQIKLCDFGIAHANALVEARSVNAPDQTAEALRGKAGYMSPEHARGEHVDARADVFAAGILLWELIAGKRMYRQRDGSLPLLEQARRADVPPLPDKGMPDAPAIEAILVKALSKNREDRYASAGAMLRDVERYMSDIGLVVSPIRLGDWLVASLGSDIVLERRRRQRAAEALELGPPVRLTPVPFRPPTLAAEPAVTVAPEPPALVVPAIDPIAAPSTLAPALPLAVTPPSAPASRRISMLASLVGLLAVALACFYALRGP